MTDRVLRVCALYPDLMNIYADRGNLLMLERRCRWRSIGFELTASSLGEALRDEFDLYYIGGGQDADQRLCAADLLALKAPALHSAGARDAVVLGVCGGYQLLGHAYELASERVEGIGLLDVHTVREDGPRLIGSVAVELADGSSRASRTTAVEPIWVPARLRSGASCAVTATMGAAASRARAHAT